MKTLKQTLKNLPEKSCILHLNVSTYDMLFLSLEAHKEYVKETGKVIPILIGVSEKERDFMGEKSFSKIIKQYRKESKLPVYSSADHTYSINRIKKIIDYGYDLCVCDFSKEKRDIAIKSFNIIRNYRNMMQCIKKNITGGETLLEAEYGFLGDGSQIKSHVDFDMKYTDPDDAHDFVKQTKADLFSPAVGTIHGLVKEGTPDIKTELITEIKNAVQIPLVLHGASGSKRSELSDSINAGIQIMHVSSEFREMYKRILVDISRDEKETIAPYDYMASGFSEIKTFLKEYMKLCENR